MPTSTAMTASSGMSSPSRPRKTSGGMQAAVRVDQVASRRLLRLAIVASGVATASGAARVGRRSAARAASSSRVRAMSPHSGTSTGWNLPSDHPVEVDLDRRHPRRDRRVVGERRAEHQQAVASATVWLTTGMPDRPSTPQPSGWSSGNVPFALKVEITGASICSANARTRSRNGRAPLPTDDRRARSAARSRLDAARQLLGGRRDAGRRDAPGPRPSRRLVQTRKLLHLVGEA